MTRALQVLMGAILILNVWTWMLMSAANLQIGWWGLAVLLGKAVCAGYITAPVYREYLK